MTILRHPLAHAVSACPDWRVWGGADAPAHVRAAAGLNFPAFARHYVACPHPDCRVYGELVLVGGRVPPNVRRLRLKSLLEDAALVLNGEAGL